MAASGQILVATRRMAARTGGIEQPRQADTHGALPRPSHAVRPRDLPRTRAYEEAMNKARTRLVLPIAPVGQPIIPGRVEWLRAEMLKTRVAHGYCSRQIAADACPDANICEQCDNYVTATEFIPQLQAQLADITTLRDDAAERGWHTEVARHSRVIASIQAHLQRLTRSAETGHNV